ncbi:MAG: DnaD domain protein [Chloroflexi bacterium]|nr:DnaD domain protein [Chloroflexota bacterium]
MKKFSGFPDGKLAVTPLPNLFFSELLPAIDDLAELKLILHIIWLIARPKQRAQFVTANELRDDPTLMQSLAPNGEKSGDALARALDAAVTRGALLHRDASDAYFLNTESGRRAFEKMDAPREKSRVREAMPAQRPNIFKMYEDNIGMLTPLLAEELKDAEAQYPAEWIAEAIKLSAEYNKRNWKYIHAILKRWQDEGRDSKKRKRWWGDEYDKHINR